MDEFFAKDFSGGPFMLFGQSHWVALIALLIVNLLIWRIARHPDAQFRALWSKRIRWTLASILVINETLWHVWNAMTGQWNIQTMLPLHLCSALVWLCAYMLITKNYRIYEFAYFLGIAGAMQAVLTPDLGIYDFPHFRYFQVFLSHGAIVTSAIALTVLEGFRPTWGSLVRVIVWGNVYQGAVYLINRAIGSNYMYLIHKPETASALDMMGPWPWYLLSIQALGVVLFLLLYLPFALRDAAARSALARNPV